MTDILTVNEALELATSFKTMSLPDVALKLIALQTDARIAGMGDLVEKYKQ